MSRDWERGAGFAGPSFLAGKTLFLSIGVIFAKLICVKPLSKRLRSCCRYFYGLILWLVTFLSVLLGCDLQAKTVFVNASLGATGDGLSWSTAFPSLMDGLAATSSGDQVWIAGGTYLPSSTGDSTQSFTVASGVSLYGGFAGNETALGQRTSIYQTILSGNVAPNHSYHVVKVTSGATNVLLDTLTITGGNANGSLSTLQWGGAVFADGAKFIMSNCVVSNNSATSRAGGVYCYSNGYGTFTSCIFSNNSAGSLGGAMFCDATVSQCTFISNQTSGQGGAIYEPNGVLSITGSAFTSNKAGYGGAIYDNYGPLSVSSSTFSGNVATSNGGAIYIGLSTLRNVISKCVFSNNSASTGGALSISSNSSVPVDDPAIFLSVFLNNSATGQGGAVDINDLGNPTFCLCLIANNHAQSGGGIENTFSNLKVVNCTISGNTASQFGGGILTDNTTKKTSLLSNSIIWNNSASSGGSQIYDENVASSLDHSVVQGGFAGTAVVTSDPLFIYSGAPYGFDGVIPTKDDGFSLGSNSSAAGLGLVSSLPPDYSDLNGNGNFTEAVPFDLIGNAITSPSIDAGAYLGSEPFYGSYQAWWMQNATPSQLASVDKNFYADPLGDGVDNIVKYFLGINPVNSNLSLLPHVVVANNQVDFTFQRPLNNTAADATVQVSNDLVVWTNVCQSTSGGSFTLSGNSYSISEDTSTGVDVIHIAQTLTPTIKSVFWRLVVTGH